MPSGSVRCERGSAFVCCEGGSLDGSQVDDNKGGSAGGSQAVDDEGGSADYSQAAVNLVELTVTAIAALLDLTNLAYSPASSPFLLFLFKIDQFLTNLVRFSKVKNQKGIKQC